MKKYALLALSLATIVGLVGLSSCSKDDPAPRAKVSFENSTKNFDEGGGTVKVNVILDQAAPQDITVEYSIDGTAKEGSPNTAGTDYQITSDAGTVKIRKGETSGAIEFKIKDDAEFEGDETIELEITGVTNSTADIGEVSTEVVTIVDNDVAAKITFKTAPLTVDEVTDIVEVVVQMDKALGVDVTVQYDLTGTALDSALADQHNIDIYDYIIVRNDKGQKLDPQGEVVIKAGETTGTIYLETLLDFQDDPTETVIFTLSGANGGGATVGTNNTTTVTLKQEVNGTLIGLYWDPQVYTDVDMDMVLWIKLSNGNWQFLDYTAMASTTPGELLFIPKSIKPSQNGQFYTFGASYIYYAGTANPLNFEVDFIDVVNNVLEDEADFTVYPGTYTSANLNPGTSQAQVEQTFQIGFDGALVNFSTISTPSAGSRTPTLTIPRSWHKGVGTPYLRQRR